VTQIIFYNQAFNGRAAVFESFLREERATSPKRRLWRMKRGDVGEKQGA